MTTKNTTSEWKNPHELDTKSALRGAACSPSFDTTETDAAWSAHCIDPDSASGDPWDLAKKLETELTAVTEQRNEAREQRDRMAGLKYPEDLTVDFVKMLLETVKCGGKVVTFNDSDICTMERIVRGGAYEL